MNKPSIPFNFVLEYLLPAKVTTRPMFGCHAIYKGDKIVLIVRNKEKSPADNGVWVATEKAHHESLRKDFPSMRPITVFGDSTGWQNLPADAIDFEELAIKACDLILKGDPRIGKVPKAKSKKISMKKVIRKKTSR